MATSLKESKRGPVRKNSIRENRSSIDPEIICLKLKKEITEGKIYSPVGKFAVPRELNKSG